MVQVVPAGAPSPYGRSREIAGIQAAFDKNNAQRAASFGDYRASQMDTVGRVLGQTAQLGELFGGMQTGKLLEMYLNSGVLGKGMPTNASLTGDFTGQRDALSLAALARKNRGGGGSGKPSAVNFFYDESSQQYFSVDDPKDAFPDGLSITGVRRASPAEVEAAGGFINYDKGGTWTPYSSGTPSAQTFTVTNNNTGQTITVTDPTPYRDVEGITVTEN